jgi:hypothetical protein
MGVESSSQAQDGRPTHSYGANRRDYRTSVTAIVRWELRADAVLTEINTEKANIAAADIIGETI